MYLVVGAQQTGSTCGGCGGGPLSVQSPASSPEGRRHLSLPVHHGYEELHWQRSYSGVSSHTQLIFYVEIGENKRRTAERHM